MKAFARLEGVAAPLRMDNVDTDVIIPMDALLSRPREELGACAFEPLRYAADGCENAGFVLNRPVYRRACILIAGRNFGCGSSREGAVHALAGFGFRAVIAPSFGDIFFSNCLKNGVLPVRIEAAAVERLMDAADAAAGAAPFQIDLPAQTIRAPDRHCIAFEIDRAWKDRLLSGADETSVTLQYEADIRAWQARDRTERPWAWTVGSERRQ